MHGMLFSGDIFMSCFGEYKEQIVFALIKVSSARFLECGQHDNPSRGWSFFLLFCEN